MRSYQFALFVDRQSSYGVAWEHKQILCRYFTSLCAEVLREVDLRKEHHPLGRKTLQHPQLLERKLRRGGKVKRTSCATVAVWQLSWDHWLHLLNSIPSTYSIKITSSSCYFCDIFEIFLFLFNSAYVCFYFCPCYTSIGTKQSFSEAEHILPALLHPPLLSPFRDKVWCLFLLYGLKGNLVLAAALNSYNETAWFLSTVLIKCADLAKTDILSHFLKMILVVIIFFGLIFKRRSLNLSAFHLT